MNPSRRMLWPSGTWLAIAAIGAVAVGSAVGAGDMGHKKPPVFSQKQTSRIVMISRAQANSRINARAHTLSVKSAESAKKKQGNLCALCGNYPSHRPKTADFDNPYCT